MKEGSSAKSESSGTAKGTTTKGATTKGKGKSKSKSKASAKQPKGKNKKFQSKSKGKGGMAAVLDTELGKQLTALGWSDARVKAYMHKEVNPNAYFYRFLEKGEKQATGSWTAEEKRSFLELIKDGVDYRWGILSMNVPGRVGYQCSNYYRKLVAHGE